VSDQGDDSGLLSWHDNVIYGIHCRCADPSQNVWRSELVLDIDYIVDWVRLNGGGFKFLIAPAILVFHNVTDLEISLDCRASDGGRRYLNELSIHDIARQPAAGDACGYYQWRVDLNLPPNGRIKFGASDFTQRLSAPARLCDDQRFPSEHRPAFSLAAFSSREARRTKSVRRGKRGGEPP
jgi:hypothetical protein